MTRLATTAVPRLLPLIVLPGLLLGASAGCSETKGVAAAPREIQHPIQARVIRVAEQEWSQEVATQGNLVADETTIVGARVAGRIEQVLVDLGDFVEEGTVLAHLDRREHQELVRQAEAELAQARAALGLDDDDEIDAVLDPLLDPSVVEAKAVWDQAKTDRDRFLTLRRREVATDTEYETAATAARVAEAHYTSALNSVRAALALVRVRTAQLELARQALADAEIAAPFAGRIEERHVSPGMYVQVGDPAVTLIRDDPLRYRGTVPEPFASGIAIGLKVRLRVESGPGMPEAEITRISPSLDPYNRSLLFEAIVPNLDHAIHPGQFAQGEVVLHEARRTIALPRSAVVEFAGTQKVWKVVGGQAVEQAIEQGIKRGDLVEILAGLEPGDEVLIDGSEGRPARVDIREVVAANPPAAARPGDDPSP